VATRQEDGFAPLPDSGEIRLPDPPDDEPGDEAPGTHGWSRLDDFEALLDDVLTYVDAEVAFQKTRASFVASGVKRIVGFVLVALFLAFLAVVGLTIGLIFALTPLVTAWGATAIVVGGLLLVAALLVRGALQTWKRTMAAIAPEQDTADATANAGQANDA
jgi:hypothetical protein